MRFPKAPSIGIRVPSLPGLHARSMSPLLNAALVAAYWLRIVLTVIMSAAFVIDLPELGGAAKLKAKGVKVHTLVSFEGH